MSIRQHQPVYLASFLLYTIGSIAGSRATNMPVLIGMRILQGTGSSAVLASGAGSLADMYEVRERGRKLGLFYGMPMLAPTLGPLIGGALGHTYGWRSALYFLAVFAGIMTIAFLFFPDTWRRERSRVYQKAMADVLKRQLRAEANAEKRARKKARGLASTAPTPVTVPGTPAVTPADAGATTPPVLVLDVERGAAPPPKPGMITRLARRLGLTSGDTLRPSFVDLNPIPPMISIFHSPTNAAVLVASGLLFACQYTTTYTASVTFARPPYSYNPLIIGVVLLSFGVGNVAGSLLGGRWSDYSMRRQTAAAGGVTQPEMRLKCTLPLMPVLLASYLTYAWTAHYHTIVAGPVIALFCAGFSISFVYSSTLAYLVDSNPGRSAPAVACNSFMRGVLACIMSQVAMPIQNAIGEGGLYSLLAGILLLSCVGLVVVSYKGVGWRAGQARKAAPKASAEASARVSEKGTGWNTPSVSTASTVVGSEDGKGSEGK